MGFLDNIGKTISDVSQTTFQKGKEMVDVAKLNGMITDEEKKIRKNYEEIGQKYFENYSGSGDSLFAQNITEISESLNKIEEYKRDLEIVKA